MAKLNYTTTIAIDAQRSVIHFYSMVGNDKSSVVHKVKNYAGGIFDEKFFERFKHVLKDFVAKTPSESIRKVTVILPDLAVLTDTVKVPTVKGSGQTQKMLDVTLGGLYRNYSDLHIVAHMADQNKQYSTIAITAIQNRIASAIYAACSENKLLVDTLSFASASTIAGAISFNAKLKNASYLFLDVKDIYSRFSFVVDGKVMGYYLLPFGLEFLRKPKLVQEDMLFDHSYAELVVLNARERAHSKALTIMATPENTPPAAPAETNSEELIDNSDETDLDADETFEEVPVKETARTKLFSKKTPRNLPKFMLREKPETREGIAYENFRVFVKWALTLIQGNEKITELGKPQFVCVNLPEDLAYVIDMVNEEAEENGINFTRLDCDGVHSKISENLELYGGLFPNQINSTNKF